MKYLPICLVVLLIVSAQAQVHAQASGNANFKQRYDIMASPNEAQGYIQQTQTRYMPQEPGATGMTFTDDAVILSSRILMNVKADQQLAVFNLIQLGESAAQANSIMNQRIQAFITSLEQAGIPKQQIFVDVVSQMPIFETEVSRKLFSKNFLEVPKGFELQKNIHILFSRSEQLDEIMRLAAEQEIYDLIKVDYFVLNSHQHLDSLRAMAVAHILAQREALTALGITLDTVHHVMADQPSVIVPAEQYRAYETFASSSIEAVSKRTGVTQVQKSNSLYYQPLSYSRFDRVVNPVVLEPVVQHTYTLRVRYKILPRGKEAGPEREYLWMTPQGTLVPVKR